MAKMFKVYCNFKRIVVLSGNKSLRTVNINIAGNCTASRVVVAWTYGGTEEGGEDGANMVWHEDDPEIGPPIYNLCEFNHNGPVVFGINMSLASYPPEFRPRPVDGAGVDNRHRENRKVEVWPIGCECGPNTLWVMNEMSAHDGPCGF
jgi:hypothetical protein